MSLKNIDKKNLIQTLETSNSLIIFTTGRAGTDFLQSCYDNHSQIASTSEKCEKVSDFINKNLSILANSKKLFATLMINEILFSFAPYLNLVEDWQIKSEDNYRKADPGLFIEAFTYLLEEKSLKKLSNLYIIKACILSFKFSINKNIKSTKTILIHLHNLNQLKHYINDLNKRDVVIICSRNIYDLVGSGVFHWHHYFRKNLEFDNLNNLKRYRDSYLRTVFDYKKVINYKKNNIYLTMLEKLSSKEYLNKINNKVKIKEFKFYPNSTVLGMPRRPDLLSKNTNNSFNGFNNNVVNRGTPIKRIGIIDSILISVCHSNRIKKYNIFPNSKLLKFLIRSKTYLRLIIFFFLILIPTKIELYFFYRAPLNIIKLTLSPDLVIKEKIKQISKIIFYLLNYPYELFIMRINRFRAFMSDIKKDFIKEIY